MKLAHTSIAARLRLGFLIILVASLAVAATGLYELARSNAATRHIVQTNMRKIVLLEEMSNAIHIGTRVIRSMALLPDRESAERERPKIAEARTRYDAAFDQLRAMPLDAAGQDLVQQLERQQKAVRPMNDHFVDLALAGHKDAIRYLLDVAGPEEAKWQDAIRAFMALQNKKSEADASQAQEAYESARAMMLGLAIVTFAAGLGFALWITGSIRAPLDHAVEVAHAVSAGDLTTRTGVAPGDRSETGQLLRALNHMNDGLDGIVRQVREGSHALATNAAEIAAGNLDLSARTEQQAGTLQETAAAMEELTSTVRNNADNARRASTMARHTAELATHGGAVVSEVVSVMTGIESSSTRIVEIIDVINGIAFQTNILALNAAVEAARAGEQGRGFAVVASEVRTLAQRSATAAHDIKELIHGSVGQIKTGSTLVQDAGTTMRGIVAEIGNVAGLVSEIATATEQQSAGIEQTYRAVTELDQITQHNTALVEEVAATAAALKDGATALEDAVSRFELQGAPARGLADRRLRLAA